MLTNILLLHTHTYTHVYTRTCAPYPSNATQNAFTENTALNKRDPKKANVFPLDHPVDRKQVATVKSSLKAALDEQVQRKENTRKFAKSIERAEDRYVYYHRDCIDCIDHTATRV
jgi:hypothetical protein